MDAPDGTVPDFTGPDVTVFVCVTCRAGDDGNERPGHLLFDAVAACLQARERHEVVAVECLSVCKRPCTVALAAPGKWTYVVGDLDQVEHVGDVVAMALRYAASKDGIVPWKERPPSFRRGVVSRVPPLG
jgi:predicted metal-binding protein